MQRRNFLLALVAHRAQVLEIVLQAANGGVGHDGLRTWSVGAAPTLVF